jgi:hypothetical protein
MSALPTPSVSLAAPRPRTLVVPPALVTASRTLMLLGLALLVPGEAARISERL